jgi:hypothetical protein
MVRGFLQVNFFTQLQQSAKLQSFSCVIAKAKATLGCRELK